ncbi:MAG: redox-sensing transcriptional repressor Rex [Clostridia bacterium]|nr:redox-sensing transcriptional repressor Rex [Clostridia bacterium]
MAGYVSEAVIKRLPGYYRHLRELEAAGVTQISSQELGRRMQLTASQIRQDINCFGGFGRQGYGYKVSELKGHIGEILGLNRSHKMIIVGAGNIGSAVASYPTFSREGFTTKAIFDVDPEKVGTQVGGLTIQNVSALEEYLDKNKVDIAVIAVPAGDAQGLMNTLAAKGVRGIWNFAPTDLRPPEGVVSVNVHLSDTLQILSYKMLHRDEL